MAKDKSNAWDAEELRRDLKTALGTTKWQVKGLNDYISILQLD